ncbi:MAG: TIGR03960 family B12-binding radical SAM protein [Candidatus Omnitrophica bacterium]|nr:TIGR03960 family B12-binding radical SAM protein [Candidatus Omnitrophota bacterium]
MPSEDILLQVNKPARYIGEEWNVPRKNFDAAGIRFGLCFPDLYEVGMSNLGIRILYGLLNNIPGCCCERIFACDTDLEKILRESSGEILSLESKKRLKDFDFIGFSLGSELGYTNILNILELGNIPLFARERSPDHPLVVGGGPCMMNPEPVADFFDLFVIGEAEEALPEIVEAYRKVKEDYRRERLARQDLLLGLSAIEGVYVPQFYEATYKPDGTIDSFLTKLDGVPQKINKRVVKDLDTAYYPLAWLVPYIQVIHDRFTLELVRGCPNKCRFCQARSQYYPLRYKRIDRILEQADKIYKSSGYEECSLSGLSVSDYPHIEELIVALTDQFKEKQVALSLPSIKARALVGNLSRVIAGVKKTGLTFAPEAGTGRLREVLAKDFDEEDFFKTLEEAYASGYQHVKLYFMIGLPQETEEDLKGIIELSERVSQLKKKAGGAAAKVNISVNTMVPKPHTPFQWHAMAQAYTIKEKQEYLRKNAKNKRLTFSFHNRFMALLEAILSRGDRRLSEVIYLAHKKGARFDAWGDHFAFEIWEAAFREAGLDAQLYLKARRPDEILPWDFLDTGISREALAADFNKIVEI